MKISHPQYDEDFLTWRVAMGLTVEIVEIKVQSERRKGRGTELINILKEKVPPYTALIYAITRESNGIAQDFYKANGFRLLGKLYEFYREPEGIESALVYGLDL